jgi:hypothetical protein
MSNAARIALIGGQGWPLTETAAGLPMLQQRLSAQGVEVQTFAHDARQAIHDWLHGHSGFRALIGDSLGAGAAALYSGDLDGAVDFAGGFSRPRGTRSDKAQSPIERSWWRRTCRSPTASGTRCSSTRED